MATVHPEAHGEAHGEGEHGHSPYLHHHFETPVQQFESDKMGMWLFLATEILLFGGLFCAYSVYRHNHPDVFIYAHQFLNKILGGTNTIVLIFSSFTMAWAVRAIQRGQRILCATLLVITLMCAATFMVIKYFEYSAKIHHGLLWGSRYKPHHEGEAGPGGETTGETGTSGVKVPASEPGAQAPSVPQATAANAAATNAGDHPPGVAGQSGIVGSTEEKTSPMPVQDKPAVGISHGPPDTQVSQQNVANAEQKATTQAEQQSHVPPATQVQGQVTPSGTNTGAAPLATGSAEVANTVSPPGVVAANVPADYTYPAGLKREPSKIKPAALPPAGIVDGKPKEQKEPEPKNVQTFFAIYFAMTGLHGIHVLIGMIVISIMLVYVLKGKYNADYWTPIDLVGLYWHVVDLIWIFLFPLLYLISK